jgi:hypothetical protein
MNNVTANLFLKSAVALDPFSVLRLLFRSLGSRGPGYAVLIAFESVNGYRGSWCPWETAYACHCQLTINVSIRLT